VLGFVIFCNVFGFWVYLSIGDFYVPRTSVAILCLMVSAQLVCLFPFLSYLFYFLEPDKVVTKIMSSGLEAAYEAAKDKSSQDIDKLKVKII
jgi:hypothetical protein